MCRSEQQFQFDFCYLSLRLELPYRGHLRSGQPHSILRNRKQVMIIHIVIHYIRVYYVYFCNHYFIIIFLNFGSLDILEFAVFISQDENQKIRKLILDVNFMGINKGMHTNMGAKKIHCMEQFYLFIFILPTF